MLVVVKIVGVPNEVTVEVPPTSTLKDVLAQMLRDNVLTGFQNPEEITNSYLIYVNSRAAGLKTAIKEGENVLMVPALEGG